MKIINTVTRKNARNINTYRVMYDTKRTRKLVRIIATAEPTEELIRRFDRNLVKVIGVQLEREIMTASDWLALNNID